MRILCRAIFTLFFSILASTALCENKNGLLDLSQEEFNENNAFSLSTKWRFYWSKFLVNQDDLNKNRYTTVSIPSAWNTYTENGTNLSDFGYGTYNLKIILPKNRPNTIALKTRRIKMASKIFVNGQMLAELGTVSDGSVSSLNGHRPKITLIDLQDDVNVIDLTIQVSNFSYSRGGLTGAIKLGSVDAIYKTRSSNLTREFLFFGALLIICLYHIVIWLKRRGDHASLYFSLFCFLIALRQTLTGEKYIFVIFPHLTDATMLSLEFGSIFCAIPILHIFVSSLFREEFWQPLKWVSYFFLFYETIKLLFTPLLIKSYLIISTEIYIFLVLGHIVYVGFRALRNRRIGAFIFFIGILIFFMLGVNDIFHERGYINTAFLSTWGVVAFVFAQASVISFRFSAAFNDLAKLRLELEDKVDQRTKELQDARDYAQNLTYENRKLSAYTVELLEEERKLISKEMHDSIGNTFVTIRVHLDTIIRISKTKEIIEIAENLISLSSNRYELVRNIVRRLRPEILNTLGLFGAISELVRTQNLTNNTLFVNNCSGNVETIPESMALGIYRIIQEAITNILKHSNASNAQINLDIDNSANLTIIDDGCGFDLNTNSEGVGLISIRERVFSFGGKIDIVTSLGQGTKMLITIPL